eukprot:1136516-Pelagomonas_calceolata.AAC.2
MALAIHFLLVTVQHGVGALRGKALLHAFLQGLQGGLLLVIGAGKKRKTMKAQKTILRKEKKN